MKDYYWANEKSRTFLSRGYLQPEQTVEERVKQIADYAESILKIDGFSSKLESYVAKGWISFSSPVWANFGANRGLPISCNGSYANDDTAHIFEKVSEIGILSKYGAGTSIYLGDLRPRGSKISGGGTTSGAVHFMRLFETTTDVISQSGVRRGNCAVYLPIDHPDILEFLQCHEDGNEIQTLSLGVCITDAWMQAMVDGDKEKRKLWTRLIEKRFSSGYPYIFFTDTVNEAAPEVYKKNGKKIHASNLCAEICLSSSPSETFVCNLTALNLIHYFEWRDSDVVETAIFFLDAVMTDYINRVKNIAFLESAYNFAVSQRALGLGVLGYHSLLQSRMIPFESMETKFLNNEIFKLINERAWAASAELAKLYGEPELMKGTGYRNVTTSALMPTTSSSAILGQPSQSIEPYLANYFVDDKAKSKMTFKNPYLKELLKKHDKDTQEVWKDILVKGGSVQHLDFLSNSEREVFKTFGEISQKEIIIQASQRQKYIDQSQSLNLMVHPKAPLKDVNALYIEAWKLKVKTLYYQRSTNPAQELGRDMLSCKSCAA